MAMRSRPRLVALALVALSVASVATSSATLPAALPAPWHGAVSGARDPPVPVPGGTPNTPGSCGSQVLQCVCPPAPTDPNTLQNTDPEDRTLYGCPIRVYDTSNPFGNPQIVVNPSDPDQIAFISLHGDGVEAGVVGDSSGTRPSERSRASTVSFTSANDGITWSDQPIGTPENGLWGEMGSGAMDHLGNLYVLYLYSRDVGQGNASAGGEIVLYKAAPVTTAFDVNQAYTDPFTIDGRTTRNPIPAAYVVDVPPHRPPPPAADYANTTEGNATSGNTTANESTAPGQDGNYTDAQTNFTDERIVVSWFERAADPANNTAHKSAWIDFAVTDISGNNTWHKVPDSSLVGPCKDASNPVAYDGRVYVACSVESGYKARRSARVGDIDVWSLDPLTGTTRYEGTTGLVGGHPMLATTPHGYMALATYRRTGDNAGSVQVATGWFGSQWHRLRGDLGAALHQTTGGKPQRGLSVNAIAVSDDTKNVMLVYKEWLQQGNQVPSVDPNNPPQPGQVQPRLTDYKKSIFAFNECGPIGALQMVLGQSLDAPNAEAYSNNPGAFNDILDGLQTERDPSGQMLFTFAIDDYGAMQYGSVIDPQGPLCFVAPPVPAPPVPVVPQSIAIVNPASVAIGSVVGVVSAAMVAYLLTVKRRVAVLAVAEDK